MEFKIKKKNFLYFLLIIIAILTIGVVNSLSNFNILGHPAEELGPGIINTTKTSVHILTQEILNLGYGDVNILGNAEAFRLTGSDHIYIGFYPDGGARRAYLGFSNSGNNGFYFGNDAGGNIVFNTSGGQVCINGDCQSTWGGGSGSANSLDAADGNPTEVVYVDNAGLVGVGTTNPGEELDVVGDLRVSGDLKVSYAIDEDIIPSDRGFISCQTAGSNLIGGGCRCIGGNSKILVSQFCPNPSNPSVCSALGNPVGWACVCEGSASSVRAYAVCANVQQ